MKALTKDRCSDPYGLGCRSLATGFMLGHKFGEADWDTHIAPQILITINLCSLCAWWNADWDWDSDPDGPYLAEGGMPCESFD